MSTMASARSRTSTKLRRCGAPATQTPMPERAALNSVSEASSPGPRTMGGRNAVVGKGARRTEQKAPRLPVLPADAFEKALDRRVVDGRVVCLASRGDDAGKMNHDV